MFPKYSVGRLIEKTFRERGLRRSQIIQAVGYRNVNKGLRRLDTILTGRVRDFEFLREVSRALEIPEETFEQAMRETLRERHLEHEKQERHNTLHFRPHVIIKHSRERPKSLTALCFMGSNRFKHLRLPPGLPFFSDDEQLEVVRDVICRHFDRDKNVDGMFGFPTGYIYRKTYDRSIELSTDGEIIDDTLGKIHEPKALLVIGGRVAAGDAPVGTHPPCDDEQ